MKSQEHIEHNRLQRRNAHYIYELKKRPTKAEIEFGKYLLKKSIYFQFQKGFFTPFHRIVDFYLPVRGVIIEVDGGYHSMTTKKDAYKDYSWATKRNIRTLRIKNEEVFDGSFKEKLEQYIQPHIQKDTRRSKCPDTWRS